MNFSRMLAAREASGRPIGVALIGAGKFGTMFLAQARRMPGLHVAGVADLSIGRARSALDAVGWPEDRRNAVSPAAAMADRSVMVTEDSEALIAAPEVEVVIDSTGSPAGGLAHAMACVEQGKHLVNVTVEADVLAGPLLARRFAAAGLVYSLAYGDQPALIAEQVDWARAIGFRVVCAGKGTKYLPQYHQSTPDTVWEHYGLSPEQAEAGGLNPKMFNSFLDGTKSAIEMAAVANACELTPQSDGLEFPPCGAEELAQILRPRSAGGCLTTDGTVEVVSSLKRDGGPVPRNLRWGVYVVFEAPDDYVRRCFAEYGLQTDDSGRYAALYRPTHLIGLELGISVASAALRGEPTGAPSGFRGDVATVAKRDLAAGEVLDGEGGYTVWGRLMPAKDSLAAGVLPIGLAHDVRLRRPVETGQPVTWDAVEIDESRPEIRLRREMEAMGAG